MSNQMEYLFDVLKKDTSIETVHFNAEGGWVLSKNNAHPKQVSAKDVLAGEKAYYEAHPQDSNSGPDIDVTDYLESLEAENKTLIEENDALKEKVAELEKQLAEKTK